MFDHTFSKLANHQIKHQDTHKVGSQPGDSARSLQSSSGVCVGMYGLTYSLYRPTGNMKGGDISTLYVLNINMKMTSTV